MFLRGNTYREYSFKGSVEKMQKHSAFEIFLSEKRLTLKSIIALFISSIGVLISVYYLMSAYFGAAIGLVHRSLFVFLLLMLTFILFPLKRKSWTEKINFYFFIDLFLVLLALGCALFVLHDPVGWEMRFYAPTFLDTVTGLITIILLLEATRRTIGWGMLIVAIFFLFHSAFSNIFPGVLRTVPTNWVMMVDILFSDHGIFSMPIGAMTKYIILFLTFSSLLLRTNAGLIFIDFAYSIAGKMSGGPAKTAVFASSLFGSISGSSVSNVVATGSFTIPLMKSTGYSAINAGAIESVASTGGNFMPPVMGVVAFLIAQFMGIPYLDVIRHGLIPAVLFFVSIFMMVHFEGKKEGLKGLPVNELPSLRDALLKGGHLLLSLVALVMFLIKGYTAMMAAFWAIFTLFLLSFIRKETRLTPTRLISAFEEATKLGVVVGTACATAGIIMGCLYTSGLGVRFSNIIISAAGGQLWLALVLTMIISIVLGMGMTSVGVYIILLITVIPALIKLGVEPIAAHMFAFYFGVISNITPPVALAAFAASSISGAPPMQTGFRAFKFGIASYIIPFMFVYGPSMLMIGSPGNILRTVVSGLLGITFLAGGTVGWLIRKAGILERIIMIGAALCLIAPNLNTDILGLLLMALVIYIQKAYKYPILLVKVKKPDK